MKTPSGRSQRRAVLPRGSVSAASVAGVTYVGSGEHKDYPSPAGPPRLRADATKCDPKLHTPTGFESLTALLRAATANELFGGPVEGGYPRYVWLAHEGIWYEARLVNRELGQYKGYALRSDELPRGVA